MPVTVQNVRVPCRNGYVVNKLDQAHPQSAFCSHLLLRTNPRGRPQTYSAIFPLSAFFSGMERRGVLVVRAVVALAVVVAPAGTALATAAVASAVAAALAVAAPAVAPAAAPAAASPIARLEVGLAARAPVAVELDTVAPARDAVAPADGERVALVRIGLPVAAAAAALAIAVGAVAVAPPVASGPTAAASARAVADRAPKHKKQKTRMRGDFR